MKQAIRRPAPADADALGFRPLYALVRERLLARLIDGAWPPGMLLPSEQQLAVELGVSQGTVRKALDAMAAANLVVRRQGRGTFVAEPEDGRILFQFFMLTADSGERQFPQSTLLGVGEVDADAAARRQLALRPGASVWRIERVRTLGGEPVLVERITLPMARFRALGRLKEIPNNVYALYAERFGVTIARAEEKLKAAAASAADAKHLGCRRGDPLLLIDRIAYGLDDQPVEWRVSRCLTTRVHYQSSLK